MNSSKKNTNISTERCIKSVNYFYAVLTLIGGILVTLMFFKIYNNKKEEKLMISYLISSNTIKSSITDINALNIIKQEAPSSYFVYISYANDQDIYNFEKNLKNLIDKYKLNDIFYYLDITNYKDANEDYVNLVKDKLAIENLKGIPAIIYFENGNIKDIIDSSKDSNIKIADFKNMLHNNNFEAII